MRVLPPEHLSSESVVNDAEVAVDDANDDYRIDFGLADLATNVGCSSIARARRDRIRPGTKYRRTIRSAFQN